MKNLFKVQLTFFLRKNTPKVVKQFLRDIGLTEFIENHFLNKYESEMDAKMMWGKALEDPLVLSKVRHYWQEYRFLDDLLEIAGVSEKSKVIDVGCGIASVLHFVPGKEKIGIDPLGDWYEKYYKYPKDIQIITTRGEEIPFEDNHFTHAFCSNVLDHVTDPLRVLKEIKRVLVPEGKLILTVEIHNHFGGPRGAHHPYTFDYEAVKKLTRDAGFSIEFEKETVFLGMQQYAIGKKTKNDKEIILILSK